MSKLRILSSLLLVVSMSTVADTVNLKPSDESVKRLLVVTESRKLYDGMLGQLDRMGDEVAQRSFEGQALTDEQKDIVKKMQTRMARVVKQDMTWESLEAFYIRIYRDSFTQDEVNGMLAFYEAPTGQAVIKKLPVVMQEVMTEMQKRLVPLMHKMKQVQEETMAELKAAQERKSKE